MRKRTTNGPLSQKAQDDNSFRCALQLQPSDPHTQPPAAAMEDVLTPPPQQPELAGEKRKREEGSLDSSTEDAPSAPASTGSAEDAAGSGVARHPMWKTSLCSFFRRRGAGAEGCSHGESCRYAHTEEELRPRPDGTWDPTSDRAKKLRKVAAEAQEEAEEEVTVDEQALDKCLVGLPRGWSADRLKSFLQDQASSTSAQFLLVIGFTGQCLVLLNLVLCIARRHQQLELYLTPELEVCLVH
jgi:tRNA (uracil-5-)-methyltransferase